LNCWKNKEQQKAVKIKNKNAVSFFSLDGKRKLSIPWHRTFSIHYIQGFAGVDTIAYNHYRIW